MTRSLHFLVFGTFLSATTLPAAEAVRIGGIEVPADCPLARHEHPRLLFCKADLAGIRQRIEQSGLREIYQQLKQTVDDGLAQGNRRVLGAQAPLGILYQLTGEKKYGEACRAAVRKAPFGVYAVEGAYGYDLCYDLLTPEERRSCEQKMLDFIKQPYRWAPRFIQCVALHGSGLEDETMARNLAELRDWCVSRKLYLNRWAADRGGDDNSHGYIGQHEYVGTMGAYQAWRAATGENWFDGFLWAKAMAPYYIYHYPPGRTTTVNVGINSFVIYRGAYLACDSGTRGANNPEQTKYSDGQHHERYFAQTIAHNSLTVGTEDVAGRSRSVCGGQVSRVPDDWLRAYGLPVNEENRYSRQAGAILAYETTPQFCYVAGDATQSYAPQSVRQFSRQFLYVRPGAMVIFDRVAAVRPEDSKRWYLHTMEQPACLDGELRLDISIHPEGHFLAMGDTLRAVHGGSALFSKTVLPRKAVIRVLGGPGHQFEVNGQNYDMNSQWWKEVGTKAYQEQIGLGWWRVEVEPPAKSAEDLFLHVLWATPERQTEMFPVQTTEDPSQVSVRFVADGISVEASFAKTGDVGGRLRLTQGDRVLVDRPLAFRVEDDYHQWKADPRFSEWQSHPAMRAAIGVPGSLK